MCISRKLIKLYFIHVLDKNKYNSFEIYMKITWLSILITFDRLRFKILKIYISSKLCI